jgi:hypothetical protein
MRNYFFSFPERASKRERKSKKENSAYDQEEVPAAASVSRRILIALPAERKEGICEFSNPLLAANLQ